MKNLISALLAATLLSAEAVAVEKYNCGSPVPEMKGFHNMVVFGHPSDQLYAYHLPLFAGRVNGTNGHVLMHVYQAIWNVEFDQATMSSYTHIFSNKSGPGNQFPFFSLAPRGESFVVPEMICKKDFATQAVVVSGHVESNPEFPAPSPLLKSGVLSNLNKKETVFAQRFNGRPVNGLRYLVFGTEKQLYAAHLLTDNESSFDQILALATTSDSLKKTIREMGPTIVEVSTQSGVEVIPSRSLNSSTNNKFKISSSPQQAIDVRFVVNNNEVRAKMRVSEEIYYNENSDLQK